MEKRRSPIISVLFNTISPGLGHLYCGRPVRAVLFLGLILAIIFSAFVFYQLTYLFWASAAFLLGGIFIYIAALADAINVAMRSKVYKMRWFNRWHRYLLYYACSVFLISILTIDIRENFIQAYRISSNAMEQTFLIGDYFFVDRKIYKTQQPSRGDIAVFVFPGDTSKLFTKRIVGLPGDVVEIKEKVLYVNGKKVEEPYAVHVDNEIKPHDNFGPVTVPPGHFFTLGDNRDRSYDSRYWGFVSREHLLGKARHIFFSVDEEGTIHWNRIGHKIK
jgi:signal peptidase I